MHAQAQSGEKKRQSLVALLDSGAQPRTPLSQDTLTAKLKEPNEKLRELKEPEVSLMEAIAARQYTVGPHSMCGVTLLQPEL